MFKKYSSSPLAIEPDHSLTSELVSVLHHEDPQTTVAQGVYIKGTLRFENTLRIDGFFEGEIESSGTLIVGPTGVVISNLDLKEAFISGKVKGNISVKEQLSLRGRAEIEGNIQAPRLSVDEGVSLKGHLQITPVKPIQEDLIDEDHYSSDN